MTGNHKVRVQLFGETVADWRKRALDAGFDPASPIGILVGTIETPEPDWEAIVTFEGDVPTGVEIRSLHGERLTRAVWDRVKLAQVIGEAASMVAFQAPLRKGSTTAPNPGRRSPGRPRDHDDDHYRRVAAAYNNAVAQGSKQPRRDVAKALERHFPGITDKNDHRVRAWVDKAQALGFIAERGRKSGQ